MSLRRTRLRQGSGRASWDCKSQPRFAGLFFQEFNYRRDGADEHEGDEAGGEGFWFSIGNRLPTCGGTPAEDSAKHQGHDKGHPFDKSETFSQQDSPDDRKAAKQGTGNQSGFRGSGIREISGESTRKKENAEADEPF